MYSMTGFGRATLEVVGRQITVELKSVNHRFLDISFRMPRSFSFLEDDARRQIGRRISRGHIDVYMSYKNLREDQKTVLVDRSLLSGYRKALLEVAEMTGMEPELSLFELSSFHDILTITEAEEDREALNALVKDALETALNELTEMRLREGKEIKAELLRYVDEIQNIALAIEARYPATVDEYRLRLKTRIEELLAGQVEEQRLLQEVAVMAERSAIDEELVRLKSHITQLSEIAQEDGPVGRKIDFIVQELNREVNTISSKSQDTVITRHVVDAKSAIEKLREQIQNIE